MLTSTRGQVPAWTPLKHERNPLPSNFLWFNPAHENKKAGHFYDQLFIYFGGAEGDRTPDPKTASLVLSQLSYSPIRFVTEIRNLI